MRVACVLTTYLTPHLGSRMQYFNPTLVAAAGTYIVGAAKANGRWICRSSAGESDSHIIDIRCARLIEQLQLAPPASKSSLSETSLSSCDVECLCTYHPLPPVGSTVAPYPPVPVAADPRPLFLTT